VPEVLQGQPRFKNLSGPTWDGEGFRYNFIKPPSK